MPILSRVLGVLNPRKRMRVAFTQHYRSGDWGEPGTVSGPGSTIGRTSTIRKEMPILLEEFSIRTVLDAGCGDFTWFQVLELSLDSYVGVDVVPELVAANQVKYGTPRRSFHVLDITRDPLPRADLIVCRDCLVHLRNGHVSAALQNFRRSDSRYLVATTFTGEHPNENVPLGGWRPLNLERSPFNLPPPLRFISEALTVEDSRYSDKSLGLWALKG
jgi:SAM-dependent methyltransferase